MLKNITKYPISQLDSLLRQAYKEYEFGIYIPAKRIAGFSNTGSYELENYLTGEGFKFGHLGYDLRTSFEDLPAGNQSSIKFPDVFSFSPELLIRIDDDDVSVEGRALNPSIEPCLTVSGTMKPEITRAEYLENVKELQQHILQGDIYEITYCISHSGTVKISDPVGYFRQKYQLFPAPMSVLYKFQQNWLFCLSPERFIRIEKGLIMSQPIKGTAGRGNTPQEDEKKKAELMNSVKERAENVMIADLVRNDLSRIATRGSVSVDELCGVYSYPGVHQMISTISARLPEEISIAEILKGTFPMGSMTGAPKISAMNLIDRYEGFARNIFSGSIGWKDEVGVVDMNVVIRSLMYDSNRSSGTIRTGGAITHLSNAEEEYQECMLKARGFHELLSQKDTV